PSVGSRRGSRADSRSCGPCRVCWRRSIAPLDGHCRSATALARLAVSGARLWRFLYLRRVLKERFSPGREKALVSPDQKLLGRTSNALRVPTGLIGESGILGPDARLPEDILDLIEDGVAHVEDEAAPFDMVDEEAGGRSLRPRRCLEEHHTVEHNAQRLA